MPTTLFYSPAGDGTRYEDDSMNMDSLFQNPLCSLAANLVILLQVLPLPTATQLLQTMGMTRRWWIIAIKCTRSKQDTVLQMPAAPLCFPKWVKNGFIDCLLLYIQIPSWRIRERPTSNIPISSLPPRSMTVPKLFIQLQLSLNLRVDLATLMLAIIRQYHNSIISSTPNLHKTKNR